MPIQIPSEFIRKEIRLSWRDALWGYEWQLVGWGYIVDLAVEHVAQGSDNPLELDLAWYGKSETQNIGDGLRKLAMQEPETQGSQSREKWLFLVLSWLYETREEREAPLEDVASVYCDFDHPKEIEEFVHYLPAKRGFIPRTRSQEANNEHLISKWCDYVGRMRAHFANTN